MGTAKINSFQLFCLIFLFELGSAIAVGVGMDAKRDAWLAILAGMLCGIPLFLVYAYLFRCFPALPLTGYIPKIIGRMIGVPLSIVYILYFSYIAARVLRDFGDLLITSTMTQTPLLAVSSMMMLLIAYGVYQGIETIGRTGEAVFFIMISALFSGFISIILSGKVDAENLLPVLENGWQPVISTVFPQTYTFPYGEMIVFTMILPYLNKPPSGTKIGLYAIIASGLLLSFTIAFDIAVLGVQGAAQSQFPLLETFKKVNIGNFIQRLDILVVSTLILGMFVKITVFFYAGVAGIAETFRLKKERQRTCVILILGAAILAYSILMAGSFAEHIEIGLEWVPRYLHLPLQTGVPVLLFILVSVRNLYAQYTGSGKG